LGFAAGLGCGGGTTGFAPPCPWVAFQIDNVGLDSAFWAAAFRLIPPKAL